MKVIVLAAGVGSRMEKGGDALPKCLIPLDGTSNFDRLLNTFNQVDEIDEVVLVGGYKYSVLKAAVKRCSLSSTAKSLKVTLLQNPDFATTNSLHSLSIALSHLSGQKCALAVLNSDVYYSPELLARFLRYPRETAILVDELSRYNSSEFFIRMQDGVVADLAKGLPQSVVHGRDAQAFKVSEERLPRFEEEVERLDSSDKGSFFAGEALHFLVGLRELYPVFCNAEQWQEFDTEQDLATCNVLAKKVDQQGEIQTSYAGGQQGALHLLRSIGRRGMDCVKQRRLPLRIKWLPRYIQALRKSPTSFPWSLGTGIFSKKSFRLRLFGPELLEIVQQECAKLNIMPFLAWGTLLGCERNGGFIPNDTDIDLGLMSVDYEQVDALQAQLERLGVKTQNKTEDKITFSHPNCDEMCLDIDRFFNSNGSVWCKNEQHHTELVYSNYFPTEVFSELNPVTFEGVAVHIPVNAKLFLDVVYGDWRIPQTKKDPMRSPLNLFLKAQKA